MRSLPQDIEKGESGLGGNSVPERLAVADTGDVLVSKGRVTPRETPDEHQHRLECASLHLPSRVVAVQESRDAILHCFNYSAQP